MPMDTIEKAIRQAIESLEERGSAVYGTTVSPAAKRLFDPQSIIDHAEWEARFNNTVLKMIAAGVLSAPPEADLSWSLLNRKRAWHA